MKRWMMWALDVLALMVVGWAIAFAAQWIAVWMASEVIISIMRGLGA